MLALGFSAGRLAAQTPPPSHLPALAPTAASPTNATAPIAAVATPEDRPGESPHRAQVQCADGQLEVHAENSSLNGILRAIARCTGMHITGGVPEQRVYGNYGPAAPATVLATLIDGTGSNMLLKETARDQPAELILSPRTGGPTPPAPSAYAYADSDNNQPATTQPYAVRGQPYMHPDQSMSSGQTIGAGMRQPTQTPVPQPAAGSVVTSPQPIPLPINNVNGSPNNTSPTASTYPTTNSVPLDSIRTPSTTPSTDGIVDAPNPPPTGSDTAAAMSGAPNSTPGTTNISPDATSQTATPGATNTTAPANTTPQITGQSGDLTPEQIFQQLQQRQQQQQQKQQQPQQQSNPQ